MHRAATISLSHQLATEFARRNLGVRVNVVCPGYFPSGMTVIDPENNQDGNDEHFKTFRGHWGIPFGRPGCSRDYAQCIFGLITVSVYLKPDLSRY
jgi:NAD(P)-dependent dehydrogenase (short-subunit alcohol dehydrogenase family)